jgi:membrane associated rhomboid family serine protease
VFILPIERHNPLSRTPWTVYLLIAANALIFFALFFRPSYGGVVTRFGFTPAEFVPLTLATSMFLHGGLLHLLGNMFFLYMFGDNVEDRLGAFRFLLLYFACGLAASMAQYLSGPDSTVPMIGASGAISGVVGAYMVFFPRVPPICSSLSASGRWPPSEPRPRARFWPGWASRRSWDF